MIYARTSALQLSQKYDYEEYVDDNVYVCACLQVSSANAPGTGNVTKAIFAV